MCRKVKINFMIWLFAALLLAINSKSVCQNIQVDQTVVQTATVTDDRLIKYFVEDFMISEENIQKIIIYDLTGDGFGDRDIARTYPGGRFYLLTPGAGAQKVMNRWSFGGNVKFTANFNDKPELFENAPDSVRAMGGIFAALLQGVRRNYKGIPFKLHLEQDRDVTTVEMWGYNPDLMRYLPPPVARIPEKLPVMKLIYLEKMVTDSVYVHK